VVWRAKRNAFAKHRSRSNDAVIRVYDDAGNLIEMHEHAGDFQSVVSITRKTKRRPAVQS
jgi:hypothetical protein